MNIFHTKALLAVFMPVMCIPPQPGLTSSHDPVDEGQIVSTQARATLYCIRSKSKGLASQCKAQEKYKERLDLGVTWLK